MTLEATIRANVGRLYEAFPYPSYPLLLPLAWTDGYAGTAGFAARLAAHAGLQPALWRSPKASILLAGCGEALPYVLRKAEPRGHTLVCLDLSRRSLQRARVRLLLDPRPTRFVAADLVTTLVDRRAVDAHFDSYGVLHHLGTPTAAVAGLARDLMPGGTGRVMVYNAVTRLWIRHLQKALTLLGLDGHDGTDRTRALALFDALRQASPALRERFEGMGATTFREPARFVDTFFHAWEIQFSATDWWRLFEKWGLHVVGLYDRYAELDDLPNPLWRAPRLEELLPRLKDRRFENNFELYLAKADGSPHTKPRPSTGARAQLVRALRLGPPQRWFDYDETRKTPFMTRRLLWKSHLVHTLALGEGHVDGVLRGLPLATSQRLARLGAILPGQVSAPALKNALLQPMVSSMAMPALPRPVSFATTGVETFVKKIMLEKGRDDLRRLALVLKRLEKAQT